MFAFRYFDAYVDLIRSLGTRIGPAKSFSKVRGVWLSSYPRQFSNLLVARACITLGVGALWEK